MLLDTFLIQLGLRIDSPVALDGSCEVWYRIFYPHTQNQMCWSFYVCKDPFFLNINLILVLTLLTLPHVNSILKL